MPRECQVREKKLEDAAELSLTVCVDLGSA